MPFAIDVATLVTPPAAAVAAPAAPAAWSTITVKAGDTLWHLSIANRTTIATLVDKNRLTGGGAFLRIGQRLLVPSGATPPKATPPKPTPPATPAKPAPKPAPKPLSGTSSTVHVVRAGQTMSGIALQYRVSLTKLLAANRLQASSIIYIGQRVTVPRTATKPGSTTPTTPSTPATPRPTPKPDTSTVAGSKARLAAMDVPSRMETEALIRTVAARNGIDPKLALAIGWVESGWNQRAVSYTNAVGVMQVMPRTGIWAAELAGRRIDLYDVNDNITAGVLVIRSLLTQASSTDQAIAAYYQGMYSVRTKGLFSDTRAYLAKVKGIYARL